MDSYNKLITNYLYKYFKNNQTLPKIIIINDEIILDPKIRHDEIFPVKRNNRDNSIVEFYNGYVLTKIRDKIPNFCLIKKIDIQKDIVYYSLPSQGISNISFRQFLDICNDTEFYSCILQLILALGKSQEKYRFNHNSLTIDKIFINKIPCTITYKFGSILYEIQTDFIPVITDYKNSRIQYDGFCACYNEDPKNYSKSKDIRSLLTSIIKNTSTKSKLPGIIWLFKYLEHSDEEINTLNFIDYFRYNGNEVFNRLVSIKQRTLKPYMPYRYSNYSFPSKSKIINNYIGQSSISNEIILLSDNNTGNYDEYLLQEYHKIIKEFSHTPKLNDTNLVHLLTSRLCIIKSFIIYLRLKEENKYIPDLFIEKEKLQDTIDSIKIESLSHLYKNIKSCIKLPDTLIYNLHSFYPLMNLQSVNICKK